MTTWNERLKDAYHYYERENYRAAQEQLDAARQDAQSVDDFFDDEGLQSQLRQAMTQKIDDIRNELDSLLVDDTDMDFDRANELLQQWQQATLNDNEPDYLRYRNDVRRIEQRKRRDAAYQATKERVEALWQKAQDAMQEDATTREILALMTEARDIARQAETDYEGDGRFIDLRERAESRRQRIDIEEAMMLSGAQEEQFELTLSHIEKTPDSETVPVYDMSGNLKGRMPRAAALEEVVGQVKVFVNNKVESYRAKADDYIAQGQPRAAEKALADVDKSDDLRDQVRRLTGGEVFSGDTQTMLSQTREELRQSLQRLEAAEAAAKAAEKQVDTDAIGAWEQYQDALDRYAPEAAQSTVVKDTKSILQQALKNQLDQYTSEAQTRRDVQDLRRLYDENVLQTLANDVDNWLTTFRRLDLSSQLNLRQLEQEQERINSRLNDVELIQDKLDRIANQIDDDPQAADNNLRQLKRDTERSLLEAHPDYDTLSKRINLRINEKAEIQRLQGFLNNPNPTRVEGAIQDAQDAAEQTASYYDEFSELAVQLEAHHALLRVDSIARREGYAAAIDVLKGFESNQLISGDLRDRIEEKIAQLNTDATQIGGDVIKMEQARDAYAEKRYADAHDLLAEIKHFKDSNMRIERQQLIQQVENDWSQSLIQTIDELDIEERYDAKNLSNMLKNLRLIAPRYANIYGNRINVLEALQNARDEAESNNYESAIRMLRPMVDLATGKDRLYLLTTLEDYQRQIIGREKDEVITDVRSQGDEDATRRLIDTQTQLREMAENATTPEAEVQFLTWLTQVLLVRGEHAQDFETRRTHFDEADRTATRLEARLRRATLKQQISDNGDDNLATSAARFVELGHHGPVLGQAIRAVEMHLTPQEDFGLFSEAVEKMDSALEGYADYFVTVYNEYNDLLTDTRQVLRASLEDTTGELDPQLLPSYAKLLVLQPDDDMGMRMIQELPELAQRLNQQVERLNNDIFAHDGLGEVSAGRAGETRLDKHLQQIDSQLSTVGLIRSIVQRFNNVGQLEDESQSLLGTTKRLRTVLNTIRSDLQLLQQRIKEFQDQLVTVDIADDEIRSWRESDEKLDELWASFEQTIQRLNRELVNHPTVQLQRTRLEEKRKQIQMLVDVLTDIETAIEREDFIRATTLSKENLSGDLKNLLRGAALNNTFEVTDQWNRTRVTGWRRVQTLIDERRPWQETIRMWQQPFDVPQAVGDGKALPESTPPPATAIINWEQEKTRCETLVRRGEFDKAIMIVDCAIGEDVAVDLDCDVDKLSLVEAIQRASQPPLAMHAGDAHGTLTEALDAAGSRRNQRILQWVHDIRLQQYETQREAAHDYRQGVLTKQKKWKRAEENISHAVGEIDEILRAGKGFFSRVDTKALQRYVDDYETVLSEMTQIAPQHPMLPTYNNDADYQQALEKLG